MKITIQMLKEIINCQSDEINLFYKTFGDYVEINELTWKQLINSEIDTFYFDAFLSNNIYKEFTAELYPYTYQWLDNSKKYPTMDSEEINVSYKIYKEAKDKLLLKYLLQMEN